MHLLIVASSLPYPPASGGAIRLYGMMRALHEQGHHLTLYCFHDDPTDIPAPLHAFCRRIVTLPTPKRSTQARLKQLFLSSRADIATRLYSDAMSESLRQAIVQERYDAVQFEGIEVACYMPVLRGIAGAPPLIFDTFNAEAELQRVIYTIDRQSWQRLPQALYSWVQSRRIRAYEGDLCRMADAVIAVSDEDAGFLNAYQPKRPTTIVPSGIIFDDYAQSSPPVNLEERTLIFTGKMDYRPNVDAMLWFITHILPHIPNARLLIVGQRPHPILQTLANNLPNVQLTGWVESVRPYLTHGTVYIAPLRMGSGTRLKLLEAMACGCAIVATELASAGLQPQVKAAIRLANDEKTFAHCVHDLLANAEARQRLGEQAQALVRTHYDWRVLLPRLLNAYKELGIG
jgi:glycosyltransferase involved in cell wall biosynthesis